ncbi:MAG: hypothetical protein P4M12_03550 [Gammaproteobacteria bacterium]|nr:hypothetical protein [Gammaproteobacteria bacterium]
MLEEEHKNDAELALSPLSKLRYLQGFEEAELKALQNKFDKNPQELDNLIAEYKKTYWYYQINYILANYGSCSLFLIFPITTSNQGIETFVQVFNPNTPVSNAVGYGIGVPLSIIDVIFFMCVFSVRKESIKSTLEFATQKPYKEYFAETLTYLKQHPGNALIDSLKFLINQTILLPLNSTATMTELIYMPLDYSTAGAKVATAITLFYGNEYFKKYTNPDYYEGLDFWRNKKNRPWLLKEMYKGNVTTPIQIWLQGASSIGLRVYPFFYFIAVKSEQTLGFWFPPPFIAACTFLHGLCTRYPSTFNHYMNHKEKIESILNDKPDLHLMAQQILTMQHMQATDRNLHQTQQQLIRIIKKIHKENMLQEEGRLFLFKKEPMIALLILFRSCLGGYFGYGIANQLSHVIDSTLAHTLTIPLSALFFGKLLYHAEIERIANREHLKKLQQEVPAADVIPLTATPSSNTTITVALILNVSGAIVGAMSTIGTLQPLIGNDTPMITTIITLLAIEQMLNGILFNQDKVKDTVKDIYHSLPSCTDICSFFKRKNNQPSVEIENSPRLQI